MNRTFSLFLTLLFAVTTLNAHAYKREVFDWYYGYESEEKSFGKAEGNYMDAQVFVFQPFEKTKYTRAFVITISETGTDNNKVVEACAKFGSARDIQQAVTFVLSNGERLTSRNSSVYDNRKEKFRDITITGIICFFTRFDILESDRYNTSSMTTANKEKYFAQKLRDYSIEKIIVNGFTFDVSGWKSASAFNEVCAALEKEEGSKFFSYNATAPSRKTTTSTTTSTPSKSTMYGSVRYITPAQTSSLSYLRENIDKWGKCRTGAMIPARGIAVYDANGYAYTAGFPTSFINKIKEINGANQRIEDVNVTANGYVIIFDTNGYSIVTGPNSFISKVKEYNNKHEHIISAVFNDSGRWAVVTDKNISWSDDIVGNFMKAAKEKFGFINSIYISPSGAMIACCVNGVYHQNVPSNVIEKIRSLNYIPKVVKFTDNGLYLITDGDSKFEYLL